MSHFASIALTVAVLAAASGGIAVAQQSPTTAPAPASKPDALNYTMKDIDGKDVDLSQYSGKVVLMLNVASYGGNTPQYTALEALYKKYKDKGFVIIGFPANEFGAQEPGSNADIKAFCTAEDSKYHITFPLMSKIVVKGAGINPLYKYLTSLDTKPAGKGDITWNFEKFLIGKDGKVIARFAPKTLPDDIGLVTAVESALAK